MKSKHQPTEKKHSGIPLVIGAGAFGTSIASVLASNFERVIVKVRSDDVYQQLLANKNDVYLPGKSIRSNIIPAKTWGEVEHLLGGENPPLVVSGIPTKALESFFLETNREIVQYLSKGSTFISLSKGIDPDNLRLPDDILYSLFNAYQDQILFLSGPSFASEIMDEHVTVVSLAGKDRLVLEQACNYLQNQFFKVIPSYDVKGVLLGGALKNVLAIAGGLLEGLGYNFNTRAAMITRGIQELLRFGRVFNARPETFYGLSGMGDIILTTTGGLSRNRKFGMEIAKGKSVEALIQGQRYVVEGYRTTEAAYKIAAKFHLKTPLFNGIYQILFKGEKPENIIKQLMALPIRFDD